MLLRYTDSGYLVILSQDDPHKIVDAMLETGYSEEFCISPDFSPEFIARLMDAGFLVMSAGLRDSNNGGEENEIETTDGADDSGLFYVLLPKLHLVRSVLFHENVHIKKTIKRYLNRYELRPNTDFDRIVDRCVAVHGSDWLTPPLVNAIREIRRDRLRGVYPVSFALYHDGKLAAGEFGVISGRVYTSYSGYRDEDNAGTVQLVLTAHYLRQQGFAFFDLGMPMEYKTGLGAADISPREFVSLFRAAKDSGFPSEVFFENSSV